MGRSPAFAYWGIVWVGAPPFQSGAIFSKTPRRLPAQPNVPRDASTQRAFENHVFRRTAVEVKPLRRGQRREPLTWPPHESLGMGRHHAGSSGAVEGSRKGAQ